jgi:hypothetical protein
MSGTSSAARARRTDCRRSRGAGGDRRQTIHVGGGRDRVVDHRTVAGRELDAGAERLQDEQDVGEDDGGVHLEDADGRDRDLGGRLRALAELQEAELGADRPVLRHVAARLSHEPHGRERDGLATAGREERRRLHGAWTMRRAPGNQGRRASSSGPDRPRSGWGAGMRTEDGAEALAATQVVADAARDAIGRARAQRDELLVLASHDIKNAVGIMDSALGMLEEMPSRRRRCRA